MLRCRELLRQERLWLRYLANGRRDELASLEKDDPPSAESELLKQIPKPPSTEKEVTEIEATSIENGPPIVEPDIPNLEPISDIPPPRSDSPSESSTNVENELPGSPSALASSTVTLEIPVQSQADDPTSEKDGEYRLKNSSLSVPVLLRPRKANVDLHDAISKIKAQQDRKFDETIDVVFRLGTDPRRGDQQVRGAVNLPHGTGKNVRVCVFADGEAAEIARTSGADVIGNELTIEEIKAGNIEFDKCLSVPNMMPKLSSIARVLGPRGLMPNPKLGTLVEAPSIPQAIKQMKAGRIEYRADKLANVHAGIAKKSFPVEHIQQNFSVLVNTILNARPKGVKGSGATGYLLSTHLSSTMGPGIPISMNSVLTAANRAKTLS